MSIWFAAAAALVLGIVIGFASGYRVGQGQTSAAAVGVEQRTGSAATSGAASPGQSFTESTVDGPVRLEDQPIVAAPEAPARPAAEAAGSAPIASERRGTRPAGPSKPAVVGRVPPAVDPTSGGPAIPASGPGSLQILSRPAGAQVLIDGRAVGKTPLTIPDVAAGPHEVRLELPGFNRWATTVDVQAGKPSRVAASLEQ